MSDNLDLAHVTQAGAASSQRQISGEVVDAAAAPAAEGGA